MIDLLQKFAGVAIGALLLPQVAMGADTVITTEPTEPPLSKYTSDEGVASIGWYYTSESPRRERQIAQTVSIAKAGEAGHFAIRLSASSLAGLGDDAAYELKVYESPTRPERGFINRNVVLRQDGVVRDGSGDWIVFPLEGKIALKASHFYTFAFSFKTASSGNKVVLSHSPGNTETDFRWHRSGRDSWVPSPLSLHYLLY